ncbi:hypothetical protein [Mesorhizobium sp.]|uniref:IS1096 element passenger TnpR family protein n=1 Tax=Mesorhizobium sp. TaxID=1871066 RepID=UPI00345C8E52
MRPRRTTIDCLYDFGDSWEHRLTVTGVRAGDPEASYPRYVRGDRNAPPEDCGGIPRLLRHVRRADRPRAPQPRRRQGMGRRLRS